MKVYILCAGHPRYEPSIHGVFLTKEEADKATPTDTKCVYWYVTEMEVGKFYEHCINL